MFSQVKINTGKDQKVSMGKIMLDLLQRKSLQEAILQVVRKEKGSEIWSR